MRKTVTATALLLTATLLTGCGGGDGGKKDKGSDSGKNTASTAAKAPAGSPGRTESHEVTFDIKGTGTTQISYASDTNHAEQVTLPWHKTTKVTLEGAELRVGIALSVVPGSTQDSDGMLRAASCVITVDGKKVADNQDGKSNKPCEYTLK
ncbi:hypothetical protein ACIHFE_20795 [Streptomyces sp. NPDC052396]|uniref:hypothetical protein n=1 Tax=Streptomyces sp. NPDC052396 TaxID=3365689 RepID=UPI0037D39AFA